MRRLKRKRESLERRIRRLETENSWARDRVFALEFDLESQTLRVADLELRLNDEILARELDWEEKGSDIPF